ncbi:MAG: CPBP family intramembrane metalloprotease [Deltaproteobacteria bacterium]|nr:CPBP family intramembrane metalloprotease [Candidatus Zymogenaceae bacterium]
MSLLISYCARILPGLVVGIAFVLLVGKRDAAYRVMAYILMFVLMRDAMTPLGMWRFGTEGFFRIRFADMPLLLVVLGLSSGTGACAILLFDKELRGLIVWFKEGVISSVIIGLCGAAVVAAPLLIGYRWVDIAARGGAVATSLVFPLLCVTIFGNFLEETLFRGLFYGHMERLTTPLRAALTSGVLFAFAHVFLAFTVTNVGLPVLLFCLWEGTICGLVRMKWGLVSATLVHGGAIFLLSAGLW